MRTTHLTIHLLKYTDNGVIVITPEVPHAAIDKNSHPLTNSPSAAQSTADSLLFIEHMVIFVNGFEIGGPSEPFISSRQVHTHMARHFTRMI